MATIGSLGAVTAGVWTRQEALAVLGPGALGGQLRRGRWQSPWRGVYADAGVVLSHRQRAFAAVLASRGQSAGAQASGHGTGAAAGRPGPPARPTAAACGRTAARVHGLLLVDDLDPATGAQEHRVDDVYVVQAARDLHAQTRDPGLPTRLHGRRLALGRGELLRQAGGLLLTSVLRTVLDCAVVLAPEALVCLLDDALHRGLLSSSQLHGLLAERRGDLGVVALRTAVRLADGRAESPAETCGRLLLLVLPELEPQVELFDRAVRLVCRFDLGSRRQRFAIELDGRRGHAGEVMRAKDQRRDRRSAA